MNTSHPFPELLTSDASMGETRTDLKFLGKDPDDKRRGLYLFTKCGHEQSVHTDQIKTFGKAKCRICEEQRFSDEATKAGLKLLGDVTDGASMGRRTYLCLTCSQELSASLKDVRNQNFRCNHCLEKKWNDEATAHNLTRLGFHPEDHRRKDGYDLYLFNGCGHEEIAQRSHVREDC